MFALKWCQSSGAFITVGLEALCPNSLQEEATSNAIEFSYWPKVMKFADLHNDSQWYSNYKWNVYAPFFGDIFACDKCTYVYLFKFLVNS